MISPVNFGGAKHYREPLTELLGCVVGSRFTKKVNYVKEYENPNAKEILAKMRALKNPWTDDRSEFIRLSKELGHYRIIDLDAEKKFGKTFELNI